MRPDSHRVARLAPLLHALALGAAACKGDGSAPASVARIEVTPATASVEVDRTVQLRARLLDSRDREVSGLGVTWSSTAPSFATVDAAGVVSGVAAGNATITAEASGRTGAATVGVLWPSPAIASLEPARADAGAGAFTLTVRGSGFTALSVVRWSGQDRVTTFIGRTELRAAILAADVAATAQTPVTVFTPTPGGGVSAAVSFQVDAPLARITSLQPAERVYGTGAFILTVDGAGFSSGAVVRWDGADRPTTVVSATRLTANIAAADLQSPAFVAVTVRNSGASESASSRFTVRIPAGSRIAVGSSSACGLTANGAAQCWGRNDAGQLGNATFSNSAVPVPVSGNLTFAAIAMSDNSHHTCGLTLIGELYCWGENEHNQLGDRTSTNRSVPTRDASGLHFRAVSAGSSHSCGVVTDGTAWCWGLNTSGQLGNGSALNTAVPVAVTTAQRFTAISAGVDHSCGLTTTDGILCWGNNANGKLGDGTATDRYSPVPVTGGLSFVAVDVGRGFTCALSVAGQAYCWGAGSSGQLGRGSLQASAVPVAVAGGISFARLTAGGAHTCGATNSGATYCWGDNGYGTVGNGTRTDALSPVLVAGFSAADVVAGGFSTCGIASAGAASCWGYLGFGLLGNGQTAMRGLPVPVPLVAGAARVATGLYTSCALTAVGEARCWGLGQSGALGNGTSVNSAFAVTVQGGLTFSSITAGEGSMCALTTAGAAYCWGSNSSGQLGVPGFPGSAGANTPQAVSGGLVFTQIAAGGFHTCGRTAGGAYCWGRNADGELGRGTTGASTPTPALVAGGLAWASLQGGRYFTCGMTTTGAAYCWGDNTLGQLGDGTTTDHAAPAPVSGGLTFASIAAGVEHACGLTSSGAAWCWGGNASGQLGNNSTTTPVLSPVPVSGGLTFASLHAGRGYVTCGITSGGAGYCWGSGTVGQLGSGALVNSSTPVRVAGSALWTAVSSGIDHTCGVDTANGVHCWGHNQYGQLGFGQFGVATTPQPVSGGLTFAASAGKY